MNDMVVFGCVLAGVVLALGCFALFHIYRGVNDSLANAQIGKVYNFLYEQPLHGEPERFMAKVLDVYTLNDNSIRKLNRTSRYRKDDPNFVRTRHLVTAQSPDGTIRNFYAERTKNVRRPLLGPVIFKSGLAAMLF